MVLSRALRLQEGVEYAGHGAAVPAIVLALRDVQVSIAEAIADAGRAAGRDDFRTRAACAPTRVRVYAGVKARDELIDIL